MNADIEMDDSKLPKIVRDGEIIYISKYNEYKEAYLGDNVWMEITAKLKQPVEECKTRWRNFRDSFMRRKNSKKLPSGSSRTRNIRKWHLEHLGFHDHIECRRNCLANTTLYAENPIDSFFHSMATTIKKMSPENQIRAQMQVEPFCPDDLARQMFQ